MKRQLESFLLAGGLVLALGHARRITAFLGLQESSAIAQAYALETPDPLVAPVLAQADSGAVESSSSTQRSASGGENPKAKSGEAEKTPSNVAGGPSGAPPELPAGKVDPAEIKRSSAPPSGLTQTESSSATYAAPASSAAPAGGEEQELNPENEGK